MAYTTYRDERSDPARYAAAVTPNDSTDLTMVARALYVGTAGDLKVDTKGGSTVTISGASGWMPIQVKRVYSTGTTASGITAFW